MIDQWHSPCLLFVVSNDRSVAVSVSFVCCFQLYIIGNLCVFCLLFPVIHHWQSPYLLFVVSNDRSAQSPYLLFVVSKDRSVAVSVSFVCCFQR